MLRLGFLVIAIAACGGGSHPSTDPDAATLPDTPDPLALAVQPATYLVPIGRDQIFVADGATSWSVVEGDAGGTIDAMGMYVAPTTPGTYHVRAFDGTHAGLATVTVADFTLSVLAGSLGGPGHVDATGSTARFDHPTDLVADGSGKLYIADAYGGRIRVLEIATGTVATLAGSGQLGVVDGFGTAATLGLPTGLALDVAHRMLYVTQPDDSVIRRIDVGTGEVTTFAGQTGVSGWADGIGTAATFSGPTGIAFDGANTLWVTDSGSCVIRSIAIDTRKVTRLYGSPNLCTGNDGTLGTFDTPRRILFSPTPSPRLFVADAYAIRMILASGVSTIAGATGSPGFVDQPGIAARFSGLGGLASDGNGNLIVADTWNDRIRSVQIAAPHAVGTFAGSTEGAKDGAQGTFAFPAAVAIAGAAVFVADSGNNTIRSITIGGVGTVAGRPAHYGYANGAFAASTFVSPRALALDGTVLYATESDDVRAIALDTQQTALLAGGNLGAKDGTGAAAELTYPTGLALDLTSNTAYVADTSNSAIRVVALPGGAVTTPFNNLAVVTGGKVDGAGNASRFDHPSAVLQIGTTLYVADTKNLAIRAIDLPSKTTTTLAGGSFGSVDGIGTAATFTQPTALATDGTLLYVADFGLIRTIDPATRQVTTIAGNNRTIQTTDGIGTTASLSSSMTALAYDGNGTLYITDDTSHLVRRLYLPTRAVGTFAGIVDRGVRLGSVSQAQLGRPSGIVIVSPTRFLLSSLAENAILSLDQN